MFSKSSPKRHFQKSKFYRGNGKNFHNRSNRRKHYISSSQYINKTKAFPIENNIAIKNSFNDFRIDPILLQNIFSHGYRVPTPIQDQTIPEILAGKDVIGIANTGTGKTAAFLIPLINKIIQNRSEKVLIVVPTRELAVQINDELNFFNKSLRIYSVLIIGGISMYRQISDLRQNPDIIISTPGRLKDMINRRFVNLKSFKNVVLDEVDRMVDIGFINDIKFIISLIPKERQSLFFSATVAPVVESIIKSFVKNPVIISIKSIETPKLIEQDVIRVKDTEEKIVKLKAILRKEEFKKVLIFGRTKRGVERLSKKLSQQGFSVASIHGNKSQNQRLRVLLQFKKNQLQILVATDIAARGLDIPDVSHVINFDEPASQTDYIHRIGRTGRAQKKGFALTFVG